ncbi:MAG: hypothetical protein GY754_32110 [bacterium]|nr:hypothetical protein [bacterium]
MEIYQFDTTEVEHQLLEIASSINIINFALNGLNKHEYIDNETTCYFNTLISGTNSKLKNLMKSMKPLNQRECNAVEDATD